MQLTTPLSKTQSEAQSEDTERTPDELSAPSDPENPATELPLDVVFDLLSNERRRRVLRYLLDESESTTLGELAEHVAAIENEKPEQALSSTERKRVYIVLYQCHLPKMDDANVIDFDENRKTVEAAPRIADLQSFLPGAEEDTPESTVHRADYYLGLSLVGLAAYTVQTIVFPGAWLSGFILGMLLFLICLGAFTHLGRDDPRHMLHDLLSRRRSSVRDAAAQQSAD